MVPMSNSPRPSRIERARARSRALKVTAAAAAAILFATTAALARSAHPGAVAGNAGNGTLDAPERLTAELQQESFGAGSIGQATGAPQAQTHTS